MRAPRRWTHDPFNLPSAGQTAARDRIAVAYRGLCPTCETIWTSPDERRDCPVDHATLTPQACGHCGHVLPLTTDGLCALCSIDVERE